MEKTITIKVSLDGSFETKEGKHNITDEVFDSMVEAIETTVKDRVSLEEESDFAEEVLENYQQTLPDNFKNLKDMGFKIEVN